MCGQCEIERAVGEGCCLSHQLCNVCAEALVTEGSRDSEIDIKVGVVVRNADKRHGGGVP